MNRRNGMWLTVLCILAAGIFTTSVTSSFVRESTEAAMAAVTETEARGAQISVPREASVPEASLKALMDQADAGVRGKGEKPPRQPEGRNRGIWPREPVRLWDPRRQPLKRRNRRRRLKPGSRRPQKRMRLWRKR